MKKKLISIAVVMMGFAILSMGTLAYFSDEATAHNVIASGSVEIALQEWGDVDKTIPFNDEKNKKNREGLMPGESVTKIVEVKNIGNGDAWVRMWVNVGISESGDPISNPTIKNLPLSVDGVEMVGINYDTTNWTYSEDDGYWYYNKPLAVGATTEPLFTQVQLAKEMSNMYQNSKVLVDVVAEAVQYDNNEDRAIWE